MYRASRTLLAAAKKTESLAAATKTDAAAKGVVKETPVPKAATKTKKRSSPPPGTGILKVCPISPSLNQFLGVPEASRTQAVKRIWEYIKLNNLQTPADKRVITCDAKLKTIFDGKEQVGFLEIGKLLSRHFIKTEA